MTTGEKAPGIIALVGLVAVLLFLGWGRIQDAEHRADVAEARVERLRDRLDQLKRFLEEQGLEAPDFQGSGASPSQGGSVGAQEPPGGQKDGPPDKPKDDPPPGEGDAPPGGTPPPPPSPSPSPSPIIKICPPALLECQEVG